MNGKKQIHPIIIAFGVLYIFGLLYFLFFRYNPDSHFPFATYIDARTNLVPFHTIYEYIDRARNDLIDISIVLGNIGGLILLFIPFGFFLPFLPFKHCNMLTYIVLSFGLIFILECFQLLTRRGSLDIDDVILACLGVFIGLWIHRLWVYWCKSNAK